MPETIQNYPIQSIKKSKTLNNEAFKWLYSFLMLYINQRAVGKVF